MSFIKKAMANVLGIGGTKVDTVLSTNSIIPGSKVEGIINIYGGEVSQQIQNVYIDVKTNYEKEIDDTTVNLDDTIQRFTIDIQKMISPNETLNIPFSFNLDLNCPISKGHSRIWLSTRLDIEKGVDNIDGDALNVSPNEYSNNILKSISDLGFRIKSTKNIYDKYKVSKNKFVQEFEYYPSNEFRGKLDEIEVVLISSNNGIKVIMEIDRRARGLSSFISESLSLDESLIAIDFTYDELSNCYLIADRLKSVIKKYS